MKNTVEPIGKVPREKTWKSGVSNGFQVVMVAINILALIFVVMNHFGSDFFDLGNLSGIMILLALLGNLIAASLNGPNRYFDYAYLLISTLSMMVIPIANTVASSDVQNQSSRSLLTVVMFCALFALGGASAWTRLLLKSHKKVQPSIDTTDSVAKKVFRNLIIVSMCITLLGGFYIVYELMTRNTGGILEVFIPEYSFFFGLLFLGASIFVSRLCWRRKGSFFNKTAGIVGLICFIACAIPLASVPFWLNNFDQNYEEAFRGEAVMNPLNNGNDLFMSKPFSLQNYFLGTASTHYSVKENVLFYEDKAGIDNGIRLYFDVYMPPVNGGDLPGKNATLIRIHGGAWNIGDKGASNYAQVNKYFASQGYVVFDIQYGLNNASKFVQYATVPENVTGAFTIDDMVRHIGIFTTYLADHAETYGADIHSVFISGGSAGGQLTLTTGLALSSGKYSNIMDSRLTVKGIIPFYPANGLANIGGRSEFVDPAELVTKDSPPCLIYQGTLDGIVNPAIASKFQEIYIQAGNKNCALLRMPFASHGSDIYFSGYYNQVFIYYMERFMYQFR